MTKLTKKFCLALCMCAGLGLSALGASAVNAPKARAATDNSFAMVSGAAIRVNNVTEQNNGMRFIAEIGMDLYSTVTTTQDAYFGMIIIPDEYRETYADAIETAGGDYVTAFKNANATLLNIENIMPYAYDSDEDGDTDVYRMNGLISNVRYNNLNRDFVGIGYYYVPASGYTYVSDAATFEARNAYYVAMSALYDVEEDYTEEALACLDCYKFLAENQIVGAVQPDETAVENYQANMKLNRASFDGATVDFNSAEQISLVSKGKYTTNYASGIEIATENDLSYLTFSANYASVNVSFPKPIKVYDDTVISLQVKGVTKDDGTWFKLQKYGTVGTAGIGLHSYGFNSDGNWHTANVSASVLGYAVGDVLNGVQLQFAGDNSNACVDYITVSSEKAVQQAILEKLAKETENTSYVATYNDEDYSTLISTNQTYTISDGLLTFPSANPYAVNAVTLQFVEEKTVSDGDYIVLKMGANDRVKAYKKDATTTTSDIFTDSITTTHNATSLYHNEGSTTGTGDDDTYTPYSERTWQVTYDTNCTLKQAILPLSYLGYSAGDKISSVKIAAWANSDTTKMVIDYVTYVSTAEFDDGVVADFTKEGNQSLVVGDTETMGGFWQYTSVSASGISYNDEGYVSVTHNNDVRGVRFLVNPTVLTANSTVSVTLRYTPSSTDSSTCSCTDGSLCTWCRPGYGGTYTDAISKYDGYTAGEWMTVSFNLMTLLGNNARCQELKEAGCVMYYLNFYFHPGTLDIKTITIK